VLQLYILHWIEGTYERLKVMYFFLLSRWRYMDISYLLNYASLYQIKRKKNFENLKSLLDINC
jgi:hypothetical protein